MALVKTTWSKSRIRGVGISIQCYPWEYACGFAGTSALGSVTPKANADVTITEGFEITSALNTVNVWGQVAQGISTTYTPVSTTQTPNWQEIAA